MTLNDEQQRREPLPMAEPSPTVPLRRNWAFQSLWVGAGAAFLGMNAADIAYPLIVLAITGSPGLAGLFGVVQTTVMLVMGLPAGLVADRMNRRRLLVAAELTRAAATGSVALALALHVLTLPHLLIVSAVLGAAGTFAGPARMLLVRVVVPSSQLTQALTQEEVRGGVTGLLGRPVGGSLYVAWRALPFLVCFLTFVVSAACALFIRLPDRQAHRPDEGLRWSAMFAGVRELVRNATLRAALLLIAMGNLTSVAVILVIVVSLRQQGYNGADTGLAMAGAAVGTILGSIMVRHLHKLLRPGWLLVAAGVIAVVSTLALALRWGPVWVFGVLVVFSLAGPAMRVLVDILIFRQVPDELRGRTMSATMTVIGLGLPTGSLVAGLLLQYTNVTVTVIVLAGLLAAVTSLTLGDRRLTRADWPESGPAPRRGPTRAS